MNKVNRNSLNKWPRISSNRIHDVGDFRHSSVREKCHKPTGGIHVGSAARQLNKAIAPSRSADPGKFIRGAWTDQLATGSSATNLLACRKQ